MSDAADLASVFFHWSQVVDDYRDENAGSLTPEQELRLKHLSNQLDSTATHFTLVDVAESIASAQAALDQIKTVTAQAKEAVDRLETVDRITKVIEAVAALGLSAASGNLGAVVGAIDEVTKAIAPAGAGAGGNA